MSHMINNFPGTAWTGTTAIGAGGTAIYSPPFVPTNMKAWLNVMSRYEIPEESKDALNAVQAIIDEVGDKEPTKEQWLALREGMLKFWAVLLTHILVKDAQAISQRDAYQMAIDSTLQQQNYQLAVQLYNTTNTI